MCYLQVQHLDVHVQNQHGGCHGVHLEGCLMSMYIPPRKEEGVLCLLLRSGKSLTPIRRYKIPPTFEE